MIKDTDQFIRELAGHVQPVRRLAAPWERTAWWSALALPSAALAVVVLSARVDLWAKLSEPWFVIEEMAALLTGIVAAAAAFASVVPGYDRRWSVVVALPAVAWLASVGHSCLQDWIQLGPEGWSLHPVCLPDVAFVSMVPAIAMAAMLRRGAPLAPRLATALGVLAAAGVGAFALRLSHLQDPSAVVLVWHVGAVFAFSAVASVAGRYLLDWRLVRPE